MSLSSSVIFSHILKCLIIWWNVTVALRTSSCMYVCVCVWFYYVHTVGYICLTFHVNLCVQNRLKDRNDPPQLLVDTKQTFPVLFPYTPSALSLETLHIPASLGLDFLVRVWGLRKADSFQSSATGLHCNKVNNSLSRQTDRDMSLILRPKSVCLLARPPDLRTCKTLYPTYSDTNWCLTEASHSSNFILHLPQICDEPAETETVPRQLDPACPQSPPPHYSSFCATEQFSPVLWQQMWRYSKSGQRVKGGRCRCSLDVNRKCPAGWRRSVRSFRESSERKDQKWAEQLWQMFQDPQIKTNLFDNVFTCVHTPTDTTLCEQSHNAMPHILYM